MNTRSLLEKVYIPEETRKIIQEASFEQIMTAASNKDAIMNITQDSRLSKFFFGTDVNLTQFKAILKKVIETLGPIKKNSLESMYLKKFMSGVKSEYGITWPINVSDEQMVSTINRILKTV